MKKFVRVLSSGYGILILLAASVAVFCDVDYMRRFNEWSCQLNHNLTDSLPPSFGFCFKDPSIYCHQHAVTMNGCKKYQNMGLYCCVMQNIDKDLIERYPVWFSREMFVYISSSGYRIQRMFTFLAADISRGNITSPEEMAAFLSFVMLDTHFLLNMEEHLSVDVASNMHLHKHKDEVKFVGRGALHVKGKPFYRWMGVQLNKQWNEEDNLTHTAINLVESPEILLFPTVAFRAAATIWKESYSLVQQKSFGTLYKRLSTTRTIDGITKILYNLKGNIEKLPALLPLWRRIRKVLQIKTPIVIHKDVKETKVTACTYRPLCRGVVIQDEHRCKKDVPQQILCKDCSRKLQLFFIIHPQAVVLQEKRDKIMKFFQQIFKKTENTILSIVYLKPTQELGQIIFRSNYKLAELLSTIQHHADHDNISVVLNKTITHLQSLEIAQPASERRPKFVIGIITNFIKDMFVNDDVIHLMSQTTNRVTANIYPLYFTPDVAFHNERPLFVRNKMYNIESRDDIVETFCNDAEIVTPDHENTVNLQKHERRSFVLELPHDQRKVKMNIVRKHGNVSLLHFHKHIWNMPFDESIEFNKDYNIRTALNIYDNHSRFKGDNVKITIRHFPGNIQQIYQPSSLEIYMQFEGTEDADNIMVISFGDDPIKDMMVDPNYSKAVGYFQMSCIFASCLLFICMLVFLPHSFQLAVKIKHEIAHVRNHNFKLTALRKPELDMRRRSSCCKDCKENLQTTVTYNHLHATDYDDNNKQQLQQNQKQPDNNYAKRKNSFLVFPCGEHDKRCKQCNDRNDVLFITFVHFLRIFFLVLLEMTLLMAVHQQRGQVECSILSGTLTFAINMILMLCLTEMLCYCGLKDSAQMKLWWLLVFGYCTVIEIATELTRSKNPRESCWPTDNGLQGRIVLASVVLIAVSLFLICVYYCQMERKNMSRKLGYSACLVAICIFFVVDIALLERVVSVRGISAPLFAFVVINIVTILLVFLFTITIQAKVQAWSKVMQRKICSNVLNFQESEVLISYSVESLKHNSPTRIEIYSNTNNFNGRDTPTLQSCLKKNCAIEQNTSLLELDGSNEKESYSESICDSDVLNPNQLSTISHYNPDGSHLLKSNEFGNNTAVAQTQQQHEINKSFTRSVPVIKFQVEPELKTR